MRVKVAPEFCGLPAGNGCEKVWSTDSERNGVSEKHQPNKLTMAIKYRCQTS